MRLGQRGQGWGWTAIVFTAAALFLVGRLTLLRPGNFSYLAIAAFLFALESRRGLLALPALALVWMNLHGIEWPVMLLILGAYLGEWTLARFGLLPATTAPPWRAFAAAGAAALATLATPYGVGLLAAPFRPLGFASQYIKELEPPDLTGLLTLSLDGLYFPRRASSRSSRRAPQRQVGLRRARLRPRSRSRGRGRPPRARPGQVRAALAMRCVAFRPGLPSRPRSRLRCDSRSASASRCCRSGTSTRCSRPAAAFRCAAAICPRAASRS